MHTYSKYRTLTLVFTNNYITETKQQTITHLAYSKPSKHLENIPIGNQKHKMCIHNI